MSTKKLFELFSLRETESVRLAYPSIDITKDMGLLDTYLNWVSVHTQVPVYEMKNSIGMSWTHDESFKVSEYITVNYYWYSPQQPSKKYGNRDSFCLDAEYKIPRANDDMQLEWVTYQVTLRMYEGEVDYYYVHTDYVPNTIYELVNFDEVEACGIDFNTIAKEFINHIHEDNGIEIYSIIFADSWAPRNVVNKLWEELQGVLDYTFYNVEEDGLEIDHEYIYTYELIDRKNIPSFVDRIIDKCFSDVEYNAFVSALIESLHRAIVMSAKSGLTVFIQDGTVWSMSSGILYAYWMHQFILLIEPLLADPQGEEDEED